MTTPEKKFFNKITDVSNVPFAMAVLNDKGEITEYGPYQVEFAHEIPHIPLYTTPQIKELSDEELNKAFDYYCETDEGVLRFNYELRDEWKKEQLIRWKEAFKKASFTCNGFCGEQECKENQDRCKRIEKASEK